MPKLFDPFTTRGLTLKNRIVVSPMCQYSAEPDGIATDWHLVHLGSRATGGAGLVIAEATAVEPRGRISIHDLGLWDDAHIPMLRRIVAFGHSQGAAMGIQLNHAGRKSAPEESDWLAPSALPFRPDGRAPRAMTADDMATVQVAFVAAAQRALAAGFDLIELHAAHGYLLHEFLSPLSNQRTDEYGGSLENRLRFPVSVVRAVRAQLPSDFPLWVRISATDWVEGGLTADDTVHIAAAFKEAGADLIDCSTGGVIPNATIEPFPGYQVEFARRVRQQAGIASGAVGLITEPVQAESIICRGEADVVILARELLRDPYWPLHAAKALGVDSEWPKQYLRAVR